MLGRGWVAVALVALAACARHGGSAGATGTGGTSVASPSCGMSPGDWCPSPAGDACGRHRDVKACRADPACTGREYRGESAVACQYDDRGFATNCPTVGCVSRAAK